MTQHDPMKVAFIIGSAAVIAGVAVQFTIQRDVNSALPISQRFSYFEARKKHFEIFRVHRRMFPESELRTLYWSLFGLTMLSMAFIFLHGMNASR